MRAEVKGQGPRFGARKVTKNGPAPKRALVSAGRAHYFSAMTDTMFYVAIGACFIVLLVLLFGVLTFARGGEFNRKYSNKIMRLRLAAQALAVVFILLAVWLGRQGG